jgi:hypothetical protein
MAPPFREIQGTSPRGSVLDAVPASGASKHTARPGVRPTAVARVQEPRFARDVPVVSTASAFRYEPDGPLLVPNVQSRLDRDNGAGMTTTVGRVREGKGLPHETCGWRSGVR